MSSFKGSYNYSVDNKGRVNLPAKLRKYVSPEANDTFIVTRGLEQCVFVYPADEWSKVEQQLRQLSSYDPQHRLFTRLLLEQAWECQLDSQARIVIPPELRTYANISNDVLVLGILDKIEIWNPAVYAEYKNKQTETYDSIAEKVMRR